MTKNLLLGSTALVGAFAMAAPAFADIEVTLSGQVEFGVSAADEDTIDGDSNRGYFFFMDSETKIQAEGASDNGINYSAKVELETDADIQNVNADEAVVAFWGGFGRVELGREDGAADNMFVGGEDFQAGTGGIDGDGQNLDVPGVNDSDDAAKITYFTPRIAGFQAGGSFAPDEEGDDSQQNASDDDAGEIEEQFEVGVNWTGSFSGADLTVAGVAAFGDAEVAGEDDREDYGIGVGLEFAGLGLGAGYFNKADANEGDGVTLGAKYGFGPANVSVGYSYDGPDDGDDSSVVVVSADYGLFPGVTMKGDISVNFDDTDTGVDGDRDETTAGVLTVQLDY